MLSEPRRACFPEELRLRLRTAGIIAVVVVDRADDAVALGRALLAGGVTVVEFTLRTPVALAALQAMRAGVPGLLVGAGTVLRPEQVAAARAAGAEFGVAPGLNPRVVAAAQEAGWPFAPGVMTPSDIERALELGCRLLKFFPAESAGGVRHLATISGPYAHEGVSFIPLGGLGANNAAAWLREPLVDALGGSWIAPREAIAGRDWAGITARAADAARLVREARIKA